MSDQPESFLYHRPLTIHVRTVERVPIERNLPANQTLLTINIGLTRRRAQELVDLLQAELEREHQTVIAFTITGTTP